MMEYLEDREFKITEMEVNEVDRLLNKFCTKEERIKNKLRQLIEVENDTSLVFELESLMGLYIQLCKFINKPLNITLNSIVKFY
jgi:hypothetical protein